MLPFKWLGELFGWKTETVFANVFLRVWYCEIQYFVDSTEQTHFTMKRKLC